MDPCVASFQKPKNPNVHGLGHTWHGCTLPLLCVNRYMKAQEGSSFKKMLLRPCLTFDKMFQRIRRQIVTAPVGLSIQGGSMEVGRLACCKTGVQCNIFCVTCFC